MGNLLSLNPKIHRLRADAKEHRRLPNSQRDFVNKQRQRRIVRPRCSIWGGGSRNSYPLIWLTLIFFKQTWDGAARSCKASSAIVLDAITSRSQHGQDRRKWRRTVFVPVCSIHLESNRNFIPWRPPFRPSGRAVGL